MGVLETIMSELVNLQKEIISLHKKLDSLKLQQDNEEVWKRKDIEEFTGFKYINVKELTDKPNFPKFYIGRTECYLKSEVIKYLKNICYKSQNDSSLGKKRSSLYTI